MSADNWIYILHTIDKEKKIWELYYEHISVDAYRVAHTQAIENFSWYEENELHNLWKYMYDVRWGSEVYYDKSEAYKRADELSKTIDELEYGISTIDATKYNFYL